MADTVFRIDGLDAMEKRYAKAISKDFPEEFEKLVIQVAREVQGRAKEKTPVDTSLLKDNWKVSSVVKVGGEYFVEVYNNTEYAAHVEYGHRTRGGKGLVKGKKMLQLSLMELEQRLSPFLKEWLDDFIAEHGL